MANTPTPKAPPPTTPEPKGINKNHIPDKHRYPVLVSGQFRFSTTDAIGTQTSIPTYRYRAKITLAPKRGKKFSNSAVPWTIMARQLISYVQMNDEKACILKKRKNTAVNKISSPEELPEHPEMFMRDYAYNTVFTDRKVTFSVIIATSKDFHKTFKTGYVLTKLIENNWSVNETRLETQGKSVEIGHLLRAHNRFSNQVELIEEIKTLLQPMKCDIDLSVTKPKDVYVVDEEEVKVHTRWLTISCPSDIAGKLQETLMDKWPQLVEQKYDCFNLRNIDFIPKNNKLIGFSGRIQSMTEQNAFLSEFREVVVLKNCQNIEQDITITAEMAQILTVPSLQGRVYKLKTLLTQWQFDGKQVIHAISRDNTENMYTLLTAKNNATELRRVLDRLIPLLRVHKTLSTLQVGGSKGTTSMQPTISKRAQQYLTKFNQAPMFIQRTSSRASTATTVSSLTTEEEEQDNNQPPQLTNKQQRNTKPMKNIVDVTQQQEIREYKHVLLEGEQQSSQNTGTTTTPSYNKGNNNSITTMENLTDQLSINSTNTLTITQAANQLLKSKKFAEHLQKLIAPQVDNLIQPTIDKISHIEGRVVELHENVEANKNWQEQNSNLQQNLQMDVSTITQSLISMQQRAETSQMEMQNSMNRMIQFFDKDNKTIDRKRPPTDNEISATGSGEVNDKTKWHQQRKQNCTQYENEIDYNMETDGEFDEEEIQAQKSNEEKTSTLISQTQQLGTASKPNHFNEKSSQSPKKIKERGEKGRGL